MRNMDEELKKIPSFGLFFFKFFWTTMYRNYIKLTQNLEKISRLRNRTENIQVI